MSILMPVRSCQGLINCPPSQPSVQDTEMISNSPGMGVAVTLIPQGPSIEMPDLYVMPGSHVNGKCQPGAHSLQPVGLQDSSLFRDLG